jgi:hypothetical protein
MSCPEPKKCLRCGAPVPRGAWHGGPPRVYCSKRCKDTASQLRVLARAKAAGADPMRLVRELRAETPPGRCPHCDERLPPSRNGRPPRKCGAPECERLYRADYAAGRRTPGEGAAG